MTLYIGAPIWGLKEWVGNFFPAKSKQHDFLSLYSHRLNTVEGNTTFYSLPSAETADRWVEETPPGFKLCLKFPKIISHQLRLQKAEAETKAFIDTLIRLGDRVGPSFLQLSPTFSIANLPSLISYLDSLPREFQYAVEVRHESFFTEPGEAALDEALGSRGIARIVFDTRSLERMDSVLDAAVQKALEQKPRMPVRFTRTASFAFVRFLGYPMLGEDVDLLDEWAERVARWLKTGDEVFFFCHMPGDRDVPILIRDFYERINAHYLLPPLPDWRDADTPQQLSML